MRIKPGKAVRVPNAFPPGTAPTETGCGPRGHGAGGSADAPRPRDRYREKPKFVTAAQTAKCRYMGSGDKSRRPPRSGMRRGLARGTPGSRRPRPVDHREPAPLLAGARRLDCGVQREDVGLERCPAARCGRSGRRCWPRSGCWRRPPTPRSRAPAADDVAQLVLHRRERVQQLADLVVRRRLDGHAQVAAADALRPPTAAAAPRASRRASSQATPTPSASIATKLAASSSHDSAYTASERAAAASPPAALNSHRSPPRRRAQRGRAAPAALAAASRTAAARRPSPALCSCPRAARARPCGPAS